jgi:hypothetical protein
MISMRRGRGLALMSSHKLSVSLAGWAGRFFSPAARVPAAFLEPAALATDRPWPPAAARPLAPS